jgi:hypothetical protein
VLRRHCKERGQHTDTQTGAWNAPGWQQLPQAVDLWRCVAPVPKHKAHLILCLLRPGGGGGGRTCCAWAAAVAAQQPAGLRGTKATHHTHSSL